MNEPQNYLIPAPLLQELVSYLATRPYREVAAAMQALQSLAPALKEDGQ